MEYAVASLDWVVAREDEFWIVVANLLQWRVLPVLRGLVKHHRHGDLGVCVVCVALAKNEVAFKLTYTSDADCIAVGARIGINDILKRGTVVDPIVRVGCEVKTKVRQVELLLPSDRASRFQVETIAFVKYLRVLENRDVPVQRFPFDVDAGLLQILQKVCQAGRCPKVVDKVRLNALERRTIANLDPSLNVLLENFGDDAFNIGSAILWVVVLHGFWESALPQKLIELVSEIWRNGLAEKILHAEIFVESEGEHLEFDVASS